jgi:hypothetical protein
MTARSRSHFRICFQQGRYVAFWATMFFNGAGAFALEGPPLRTGLWVTQKIPQNEGELNSFAKAVEANPHLEGICLHVGWKEVEKEAEKFDFTLVDKTVDILRRLGRKYEISVKPGADTPSYVYEEGSRSFETRANNLHRANFGQALTIPVPWDPIYQRNFSRVIEQAGKRYSGDPLCVSVVLTCANFQSAEMHLPKTPGDRAKWKAMGDYENKLLAVYKKYTDEWAKAFPKQAISLHLSKVLDLPATFNEQVIEYGLRKYPERFTIQSDQLTGRKEDTSVMTYGLVQKYSDRAHHGFQSAGAFSRGGERMGSMQMAALNLVHTRAEYWELWHDDGLSVETCAAVAQTWQAARDLGYDAYKKELMASGKYRTRDEDDYRQKIKAKRKSAQTDD